MWSAAGRGTRRDWNEKPESSLKVNPFSESPSALIVSLPGLVIVALLIYGGVQFVRKLLAYSAR